MCVEPIVGLGDDNTCTTLQCLNYCLAYSTRLRTLSLDLTSFYNLGTDDCTTALAGMFLSLRRSQLQQLTLTGPASMFKPSVISQLVQSLSTLRWLVELELHVRADVPTDPHVNVAAVTADTGALNMPLDHVTKRRASALAHKTQFTFAEDQELRPIMGELAGACIR